MKRILLSCLLLASLFSTSALTACHETTVGYLDTQYASFSNKELVVYRQVSEEGLVTVSGGTINLFPKAVATLPNGRYTVNLRVTNEGYSRELNGLFTFVVKDKAETTEDASTDASTSTNTTVDNN